MYADLLIRYLHFAGILVLAGSLISEWLLLKPVHSRAELRRLSLIDAAYGLASLLVVGAGLSMWLAGGKPSTYYSDNPIFITKLVLAGVLGLLSAYPTVFFIREGRGEASEQVSIPPLLRWLVIAELVVLACMPALAVLMAVGIGR
jgi:putative membrane protein